MPTLTEVAEQFDELLKLVAKYNGNMRELDAVSENLLTPERHQLDHIKEMANAAGAIVSNRLEDAENSEIVDHASACVEQATELMTQAIRDLQHVIARLKNR
jgi:hypothetical protein